MNINLIRESTFSRENFDTVVSLLRQYPGPVKYIIHESPVEYNDDELTTEVWDHKKLMTQQHNFYKNFAFPVTKVSWETIFEHCNQARKQYKIPAGEPVVMLTDYANEYNWFQGADPTGRKNLFVQTSMWDLFVNTSMIYPIVYQVAILPLKMLMYSNFEERKMMAHLVPRSCINDFCGNKAEITMKLRTADICPECREIIRQKHIDQHLTSQTFAVLEGIRRQFIYYTSLTENSEPTLLEVDYRERTFSLPQLGLLLPFGPMEKTVYHLFLNHPEGIAFSSLPDDYRAELLRLYENYSDTDSIAKMHWRINKLVTNRDNMSNVISRIRRKIEVTVPQSISKYYVISGENGMKQKIRLEKQFVTIK